MRLKPRVSGKKAHATSAPKSVTAAPTLIAV
jgi:hypothetical protein